MNGMLLFPRRWFAPPDAKTRLVRDEIDSLCQNICGPSIVQNSGFSAEEGESAGLRSPGGFLPCVNLFRGQDSYILHMELPGIEPQEITVEICGNSLAISGRKTPRQEPDTEEIFAEAIYGAFRRVWTLPEDADASAISSSYNNGILSITMPRGKAGPNQADPALGN